MNTKQDVVTILEFLLGAGELAVGTRLSLTEVGINLDVPIASCCFFLAIAAKLSTNEIFSKLKL